MFGHKNRNYSGIVIIDGAETGETVQCMHCGMHWMIVRGSGNKRGWCTRCDGPTCGQELCTICVPHEARIEFEEAIGQSRFYEAMKIRSRYPGMELIYGNHFEKSE